MEAPNFTALPPVPVFIDIGGERIDLSPLKLGELPGFARAIAPVAAHLSTSPDWLAIVGEHGEALIEAIAIATRRPRDWVACLETDAALHLAEAVFTVNADFFFFFIASESYFRVETEAECEHRPEQNYSPERCYWSGNYAYSRRS